MAIKSPRVSVIVGSAAVLFLLWAAAIAAQTPADSPEDLTPCTGSVPEPTQSAAWGVAFCNRTGHDLVLEFRDNDCPLRNWGQRGDIYRKSLRRGESATFSLCYVNEPPQAGSLKPGVPQLRIPGGKGIETTWSIVGDCGARSDRLNLDARTFYDRGDYKSGIILLQYPASASHCIPDAPGETRSAPQQPLPTPQLPQAPAQPAVVAQPPIGAASSSASSGPNDQQPSFIASKDTRDIFGRTVQVFATTGEGAPNYSCAFTLTLDFTDGRSFVDKQKADVPGGQANVLVLTHKYGKTVAGITLTALKCAAR